MSNNPLIKNGVVSPEVNKALALSEQVAQLAGKAPISMTELRDAIAQLGQANVALIHALTEGHLKGK